MADITEYAFRVKNITKSFLRFDGAHFTALDDVSLEAKKAECLVIGGANGSGKTLLMSIIAGLDCADSGRVEFADGERCGIIFQDADSQILGETPREDVLCSVENLDVAHSAQMPLVEAALEKVDLIEKIDFPARTLSGGEKRRLSVASILALDCTIVIFDEPYANLDYSGVRQVNAQIRALLAAQKTVLILSHELEKCMGFAAHFIVLCAGKKVFDGTPAEALENEAPRFESWGIKNPLTAYRTVMDLMW
ncbi:MAG: ABC transporter ATP-binding protein [Treponemataceae bacterium]|nr:MAG: ABC transporter ATP-binding protein [Treponemataceae bacterium]